MFEKLILAGSVMLFAFSAYSAPNHVMRGGWLCQAAPDERIGVNADVRFIPSGPTTEQMESMGRHRIRVMTDDRELVVVDAAEVDMLDDRIVFRGDADEGSVELTIASTEDLRTGAPALLYLSRMARPMDKEVELSTMIELVCTRTRSRQ